MDLDALLHDVQAGTMSIAAAKAQLKAAPYLDLGYAKLDTHRGLRTGMAEVVFCQGKADEHLVAIFEHLLNTEGAILGTRCSKEQAELIKSHIKSHELYYNPISHIISTKNPEDKSEGQGLICVVTAGTADIKVAEEAAQVCEFFGNKVERIYDAGVAGLHRLLSHVETIQAANCTIAVAGMEGALASVIGGLVGNPVIAVPTSVGYGANFHGLSALLTMLNSCSNGVATVNIDNGFGAAFIASQINRLACQAK